MTYGLISGKISQVFKHLADITSGHKGGFGELAPQFEKRAARIFFMPKWCRFLTEETCSVSLTLFAKIVLAGRKSEPPKDFL